MREILFKGKRKDNGEWVEGHLIQSPYMGEVRSWISTPEDKTRLRAIATYYGDWRAVEVDSETICQYTELTDKNGNKIWENDIVDIQHYAEKAHKVKWGYGSFYVGINGLLCHYNTVCEVIGNVFDNVDLLKGE